jgi:glycosyltransferase involved in cell wall biosynthesis
MAGFDAYRIANEQLTFAGGFRADIVIAEDPFESALVARFIADKYSRPFQIHLIEDIYDPEFHDHDPHNALRLHILPFTMKHAGCVRTASEYLKEKVIAEYPILTEHTEALPLYYNLEVWRDMTPSMSLKERYPQFKFIILHVSHMDARSHTTEVVHGAAPLLRMYPTIGLVIVGNGPFRPAIEKQVIALGIHSQVEFEPVPDEVISHMKSANVLIHLSEDPDEDTVILEAAAVKLPIIASTANIAGTLLKDGDSAFLCNGADPACVSYRLKAFLNDNLSRTRFAMNAQETVFERIEQDYFAYLNAYRNSIERCV